MSAAIGNPPHHKSYMRLSYMDALQEAQIEELERDKRVIIIGEDLAVYGDGKVVSRFPTRTWSTPISETSFTGMGIGAAMTGLRPIVCLSIASFMYLASDPIINQAAKLRFMTGGQIEVPIVFRCCMFYGVSNAAQHSDRPYPVFMNVPGLKIICPTSPADAKGLLKSAVRDDNPVMMFEDSRLWTLKEDVPTDPEHLVRIGEARIRQVGSDVTLIGIGGAMRVTLDAAKELTDEGVSVEVIDLRTLKPLDTDAIFRSIAKTGRLVLVENAHRICGVSSEIAAIVSEDAFDCLKKPIQRLTAPDVHVPFSPLLESMLYPGKDKIVSAVKKIL